MIKSKGYKDGEPEAIIAEYQKSGDPITVFCKKRGHKPSYQTLKGWLEEVGVSPAANLIAAVTPPAFNTPEGIKAQIAKLQEAYTASLLRKVNSLKAEIEKLQQDLAEAEKELEQTTA